MRARNMRLARLPSSLLEHNVLSYLTHVELCAAENASRHFPESDALWFAHAARLLAAEDLATHTAGRHRNGTTLEEGGCARTFLRWKSVVAAAENPVRRRWVAVSA